MSYYNYEDYKSEEKKIVDEAVSQITGLIREKAKQELNDVQYRLEYYKEQTKLLEKSRDNAFKERAAAQKELEEYKKQVADNEALKNAIPFKVGDRCFVLLEKNRTEETCPICNGEGAIKVDTHSPLGTVDAYCPFCSKANYNEQTFIRRTYTIGEYFVETVYAKFTEDTVKVNYDLTTKGQCKINYVKDIYHTYEEAAIALEAKQAEENKQYEEWLNGAKKYMEEKQ